MVETPNQPTGPSSSGSPSPGASPTPASPAASPGAAPANPTPQPSETIRPTYVPESHWDTTAGTPKESFGRYVSDLAARDAENESRRLTLPQNPDGYKADLPADFRPPEGLEVTLDQADPLVGQARTWAHKHGLTQSAFTEAMGLIAGIRVGEQQEFQTARAAELAKLGANATPRVDAANRWLDAMGAAELKPLMWTAAGYEAVESLMKAFQSQGARTAPANKGEQPTQEINLEGKTFAQKYAEIERHRSRSANA